MLNVYLMNHQHRILTCITGIGNPEPAYRGTRHNVGLLMLELLGDKLLSLSSQGKQGVHLDGLQYRPCKSSPYASYLVVNPRLVLVRSDKTFINLSGQSVIPVWNQLPRHTRHIVIHDDLSLPVGKVQLRKPGSSLRGHNGLRDIRRLSKSTEFSMLSVGIDRPQSRDPEVVASYVLSKFEPEELHKIRTVSFDNLWAKLFPLLK